MVLDAEGKSYMVLDAERESYMVLHEEAKIEDDGLMTALAAVAVAEEDASCMTG